ncbi:ABC transporter permease [Bacillus horti]|uniref:Simple sugar transport system permease protein n=1 Tax=Caldalkalibacillus horti TaxID=77523 RepID=A0ABT9VWA3_9BACI|nr:ABC transporter permease [Bacillus horti]MDQ0165252.1 simple sugar transport system permease protein [Bacillus horti]
METIKRDDGQTRRSTDSTVKDTVFQFIFRYGTLLVTLFVLIYFSVTNPYFLTYSNITDILRSISIVTLVAIGVTFSLIVDGFDLSVGSTVSLTTVITASLMVWYEQSLLVILTVPILIGAIVGLLNAFFIIKIKIPDLLVTLAMLYIIRGIHLTYTKGYSVYTNMPLGGGVNAPGKFSDAFLWLGQGSLFSFTIGGQLISVPVPVVIMLVIVAVVHIYLNYTRQGRLLYITGGNQEAARLSGVRVNRYKTLAYVLSGICCGIAGILLTARIGTGQVDAGGSLLMDAVAAAFVGYSVFGAGKPNAIGTFVGAVLIGILLNGLTMLNLPYYAYDIIKGSVLLLALAITYYHMKQRNR